MSELESIPFAPDLPVVRSRAVDGATFVLDVPETIPVIWATAAAFSGRKAKG